MSNKKRTVIGLAATIVITIHIINKIQYSIAVGKDLLTSTENQYFEWRFGKIRYTRKGSGNPVLLLHGLHVGSSEAEFHKIKDELSKHHEVFTFDLLGYGLSDKPNITYTGYLYVQLIIDFVKNIIGKRTDIIVSGDSSSLALIASLNDTEIFNRIVLINPQNNNEANRIPNKRAKARKLFFDTPILGTFGYLLLTSKASLKRRFEKYYFSNPYNIEEKDIEKYLEASHVPDHSSKYAFACQTGNYLNTNFIHALKETNNSILVLSGKGKKDAEEIANNYSQLNPAIEISYVKNTKQLPHLEKPEEVVAQVSIFLES
ncbi:MAG: alpha/beta fold hydrolase [Lachnospiraceae bacterium]|nr:alpha/beta fold hydrolase [Lachnospiraceae bacterium]